MSDTFEDGDEAFADNYAEREQAKALREQARAGGLRFEGYLRPAIADWLLERIEQGMYADPSVAVASMCRRRTNAWKDVSVTRRTHSRLRFPPLRNEVASVFKQFLEEAQFSRR